ncbi:MAG: NADH-quinone oxidoreductase subunit L, partial [Candidatus Zixiibacteriota bacterium]
IPIFSGFFSKDEILWKAYSSEHGHIAFWIVGVLTAALTAFYMFRLLYLTFAGQERMDEKTKSHLHESPRVMTVPLVILAVLSVAGGWIGLPHIFGVTNFFEEWLAPVMAHESGHLQLESPMLTSAAANGTTELMLMLITLAVVGVAIIIAYRIYRRRPEIADSLATKLSGIYKLLLNKYYIDELYGAVIVRPIVYFSVFLWKIMDVVLIDGLINGLANLYAGISESLRAYQSGRIRTYASAFALGVAILIAYMVLV